MATLFKDHSCAEVVAGLRDIGYRGDLLEEDYTFRDYFASGYEERQIAAAAFGETPVSYDSALIGVALSNGLREQALVDTFRALGAPIILEVDNYEIREWAVSRATDGHALVERYPVDQIRQMIVSRAPDWRPQPLLRAKNIGAFHRAPQQFGLFAGLLPELEERIQAQLEPLLHDALSASKDMYCETSGRDPDPDRLFKLIFWILTAKVFHDRRVPGFISLGADPESILDAVARQYREEVPRLLNRQAREVAVDHIWNELDFRNLSVEVLAQMWSTMLIDDDTKRRLGIHRTSRTIVRYIVERIPFQQSGDDKLIVLEPCSGSAVFLIGAMSILRPRLFGAPPSERHKYFTHHLAAIETEPFGVEISRLALTLADFPNPGGWDVTQGDVFEAGVLTEQLRRAGVVLCNPPFGDFEEDERQQYQFSSPHKPAELLNRVLDDLHPSGVLGFVLPRTIVDGRGYAEVRKRLAKRFATIEVMVLPDRAFKDSDTEVGLLIATEPIPHDACRIVSRRVNDNADAWRQFELKHEFSSGYSVELGIDEATRSLAVPALPELWDFLISYPTLGDVAELHRGVEWNLPLTIKGVETGNRSRFVRGEPAQGEEPLDGFMRGIAPQTSFNVFETPDTAWLSLRSEDQRRNAYLHPWEKPKAILYKFARSRGPWRIAAFPDSEGLAGSGAYIGVWPASHEYDEWALSAILNSPLANAFVATREGKFGVTLETLKLIPVPYFTEPQRQRLRSLIESYRNAIAPPLMATSSANPERLLMEIDALVLDGYRMPPELEHILLEYFWGYGEDRPTRHDFGDYLPPDCEVYFSLSEHLSPEFHAATAGELLRRTGLGS